MNQLFNYSGHQVRTVIKNGEPWFVAKDVCEILEVGNPSQALSRLDDDEKNTLILNDGTEGNPIKSVVNESGLYSLVLSSRKPEAKQFKKWITSEVLPSIRKHGAYMTPQTIEELIANPDTMITVLQKLKAEQEEKAQERAARLAAEAKIEADKPLVLFAESLQVSQDSILIGQLANLLKQNGINIGQNRLFELLRNEGYLIKSGERRNMPTQRSMDLGIMEIKTGSRNSSDGTIKMTHTPKITGKGQIYFINKFKAVEAPKGA